ncbi:MAG: tRNA uridine-5-carboxymethylaminomethyl(34) synthesis GTPase MnmE [Deltaproteobacteria bacterium]|nr:tRNA uridine-5-carboxymethylaminomethyl(34) synthesis GTPase MnmE [Deltaproteobacteria bacterium]
MNDTIAAISTPFGEGGIGVIRISGPDALAIGKKAFHGTGEVKERYLNYGHIIGPSGEKIDTGFFIYMKGPKSYTGEDVVELQCHGGPLILKKVLEAVFNGGARPAQAGEFTKRAYLNGKLDLSQAEAVIDLIRAQTEAGLSSAQGRLSGALSSRIDEIKGGLFKLLTHIEAELDFPEDEIDGMPDSVFLEGLTRAEVSLKKLIATYDEGRVIRDGIRVLILGRPNVGKSSLLNILLKEERAIVTPVPGTTRDIIEEVVNLRGIPLKLMDTAGLRDTDDHVESIGVRAAREKIKDAQLIVFVVDASSNSFTDDIELLKSVHGKKVIVAANKTDLVKEPKIDIEGFNIKSISALRSTGIEELKDEIYKEAVGHSYGASLDSDPGQVLVSARHKSALDKCLEGIERTKKALACGLAREFTATDLRWSIDRLGEITGETTTEEILESIFNNFCIGK